MNTLREKVLKLFKNKVVLWSSVVLGFVLVGSIIYISINKASNLKDNDSNSNLEVEFSNDDLVPGEPYLLMDITDYPERIKDFCQSVYITFEAENVGDTALRYSDFEDKYYFQIISDDSLDGDMSIGTIDTTRPYADYAGLVPYTKIINDFGEILPGEKKEITFNCLSYISEDQHSYFWINSFFGIPNGRADYYVQFGRLSDKGMFYDTGISDSSTVSIVTDLKDSDGGEKYCPYEVIEDFSIDFNQ